MDVERFCFDSEVGMVPDQTGDYVKFEDYVKAFTSGADTMKTTAIMVLRAMSVASQK